MDLQNSQKKKFFSQDQRRMDLQDGPILPAPIANQNTGFASPCPVADSAIYMYNLVTRFSLAP